jgi:hypothetical protein
MFRSERSRAARSARISRGSASRSQRAGRLLNPSRIKVAAGRGEEAFAVCVQGRTVIVSVWHHDQFHQAAHVIPVIPGGEEIPRRSAVIFRR